MQSLSAQGGPMSTSEKGRGLGSEMIMQELSDEAHRLGITDDELDLDYQRDTLTKAYELLHVLEIEMESGSNGVVEGIERCRQGILDIIDEVDRLKKLRESP
jgi:hypothetical protein